MANSYRGEVEFEAGGRKLTLCLNFNALREIEQDVQAAETEFEGIKVPVVSHDVRAFLALLMKKRGTLTYLQFMMARGLKVGNDEAAEVIQEIGLDAAGTLINAALMWMLPDKERQDRKTKATDRGKASPPAGTT